MKNKRREKALDPDVIKADYRSLKSATDVAKKHGVDIKRVTKILRELGVEIKRGGRSKTYNPSKTELQKLLDEHGSIQAVARHVGFAEVTIRTRVRDLGIPYEPKSIENKMRIHLCSECF